MTRTLSSSVCLSSSLGGALLAAAIGSPAPAAAQQNTASANERVTLVACVARQEDYVRTATAAPRSGPMQLLLIDAGSGTPRYTLTGVREPELTARVGGRVEISGTVEQPRVTPVLTTADGRRPGSINRDTPGAVGVTPDGAAAHEPSDALSATVPAGQVAVPSRVSDPDYLVETLPALNVTAYREVSGACDPPPARVATAAAPGAESAAPAPARVAPQEAAAPQPITIRGCLARQTELGTALSAPSDSPDALVLTKASLAGGTTVTTAAAVPGSTAAGRGSGTVPETVGTTGAAAAEPPPLSFALDTQSDQRQQMMRHVGERVEVVGIVAGDDERRTGANRLSNEAGGAVIGGRAEAPKADPAHPSAPVRAISVTAFRPLGGSCN